LVHDKKVNVRIEALTSLAKIRPVSAQAGRAMEKAAADDDSVRVRLQAKASLPKYHLAGYSSKNSGPAPGGKTQTEEPPLATPVFSAPPRVPQLPPPVVSAPPPVVSPPPPVVPAPPAPKVEQSVPADPPIPRPFPPVTAPPVKTAPAQGPSLFP
jgi:hypothetical protein